MPSRFRSGVLLVLLAAWLPASASSAPSLPAYMPGEVLIKFKPAVKAEQRVSLESELHGQSVQEFSFIGVERLKLEAGVSVEQVIARYRADPRGQYVEPNYLVHADLTPNDPRFAEQ